MTWQTTQPPREGSTRWRDPDGTDFTASPVLAGWELEGPAADASYILANLPDGWRWSPMPEDAITDVSAPGWIFRLTAPDGRFVDFEGWSAEHVEGFPGDVELRWAGDVYELMLDGLPVTDNLERGKMLGRFEARDLLAEALGIDPHGQTLAEVVAQLKEAAGTRRALLREALARCIGWRARVAGVAHVGISNYSDDTGGDAHLWRAFLHRPEAGDAELRRSIRAEVVAQMRREATRTTEPPRIAQVFRHGAEIRIARVAAELLCLASDLHMDDSTAGEADALEAMAARLKATGAEALADRSSTRIVHGRVTAKWTGEVWTVTLADGSGQSYLAEVDEWPASWKYEEPPPRPGSPPAVEPMTWERIVALRAEFPILNHFLTAGLREELLVAARPFCDLAHRIANGPDTRRGLQLDHLAATLASIDHPEAVAASEKLGGVRNRLLEDGAGVPSTLRLLLEARDCAMRAARDGQP